MRDLTLSVSLSVCSVPLRRDEGHIWALPGSHRRRKAKKEWRGLEAEQGEAEPEVPGPGSGKRKQDTERAGSLAGQCPGLAGAGAHMTPRLYRLFSSEPHGIQPGFCYLLPRCLASAAPPCTGLALDPGCREHSRRRAGSWPHRLGAVSTRATRGCPPHPTLPLQGCSHRVSCRRPLVKWVVLKINPDPGTELNSGS